MKKMITRSLAVMSAAMLVLSACGAPPSDSGGAGGAAKSDKGKDFKACMVSDSGGFQDKSFNQTSYKGLTDAKQQFGIQTNQIESKAVADFGKNIQSMVDAKCNMIVTVGYLLGPATIAAAKQNPDVEFAIVDFNNPAKMAGIKNLKSLMFNTAEPAFMAGYLAAGMTKSGKVGTFGGMNIPTVTIFMDGFAQGVKYYNEKKSKDVQVVGWDVAKQDGQFVPKGFEDVAGGKQIAQNLASQGADIIMPVAGPAGEGGLQVAQASSGKVNAVWVDTDGCVSAEKFCPVIMSSVAKAMDHAVTDAIESGIDKKFDSTMYVGTLQNEGAQLSGFHTFDSKVPAELKSELDQVKADIISGKIKIESKAQPTT